MVDYADAKRALERLHRELMHLNPSAARSLQKPWKKRSPFTSCASLINSAGACAAPT